MSVETAASPDAADVQDAINAAGDGGTVYIPAGTATWNTTVSAAFIGITIVGAGRTSTVITVAGGIGLQILTPGVKSVDVSNIGWVGSVAVQCIQVTTCRNMRLHHMTFTLPGVTRGVWAFYNMGGSVIDNCTFQSTANESNQAITVYGDSNFELVPNNTAASFPAGTAWTRTGPEFGTNDFLFVEQCIFDYDYPNDSACETYSGGRVVFRHNYVRNLMPGVHGLDSNICGGHAFEIYENDFYWDVGRHNLLMDVRSGALVCWNNRCHANISEVSFWTVVLNSYRAIGDSFSLWLPYRSTHTGGTNATVMTDSTAALTINDWAQAESPGTIYNFTDGSIGQIVSNTATTVTVLGLTGGVTNQWQNGDEYGIATFQGGMLNGINKYDTNEAVPNGSGTHTGSANASVLTDSSKTGGSAWTTNQFNGTGGSFPTRIQHTVWNLTDGSWGRITANTDNTVTAKLVGGTDNDWDAGDSYVITYGWPGLEQVGTTGPVTLGALYSTLTKDPVYTWNNKFNPDTDNIEATAGAGPDSDAYREELVPPVPRPYPTDFLRELRDYFIGTPRPGYTPYAYPHPLNREAGAGGVVSASGMLMF